MPTQVSQIYSETCRIFYEDIGFSAGTGCLTDDQFFKALSDTLLDMMDRVGCTKKIINIPIVAGTSTYTEPDITSTVQSVHASQTYIFRTSGLYINAADPYWDSAMGQPSKFREDKVPMTLQLIPNPNIDGFQVAVALPGGYGTISSTSSATDFDIVMQSGYQGYGTISAAPTGAVYLEAENQGFGIPAYMIPSTGNLQIIVSALPFQVEMDQNDWIELLPDPFIPWLKYGICARLFSSDSEAKNVGQGEWCRARYEEGLQLIESIMSEDEVDIRPPGQ